jgi:opacity protein-like surface antigen
VLPHRSVLLNRGALAYDRVLSDPLALQLFFRSVRKSFVKLLYMACVVCLVGFASAARADEPRFDVAGSYGYLHDQTNSQSLPHGWVGSFSATVDRSLSAVGEIGGTYQPSSDLAVGSTSIYSYLAGARYGYHFNHNVTVFGQFLLGAVHSSAGVYSSGTRTTDLSWQPGGGVDLSVAPRWGVRLEGDYRGLRDNGVILNQSRFAAGLVFRP